MHASAVTFGRKWVDARFLFLLQSHLPSCLPYFSISLPFVTQINHWHHWVTQGTPPPSPLHYDACLLFDREKSAEFSALDDSHRFVRTHAS